MAHQVMIIEDDPFIALDMESVMEDAGYDVLGPVASSPEALKLLERNGDTPDCALLDFYVTGGTTEYVARELGRRGVPYMFLTGNKDDVLDALGDQAPLVRSKPVRVRRVVEDVQNLIAA